MLAHYGRGHLVFRERPPGRQWSPCHLSPQALHWSARPVDMPFASAAPGGATRRQLAWGAGGSALRLARAGHVAARGVAGRRQLQDAFNHRKLLRPLSRALMRWRYNTRLTQTSRKHRVSCTGTTRHGHRHAQARAFTWSRSFAVWLHLKQYLIFFVK